MTVAPTENSPAMLSIAGFFTEYLSALGSFYFIPFVCTYISPISSSFRLITLRWPCVQGLASGGQGGADTSDDSPNSIPYSPLTVASSAACGNPTSCCLPAICLFLSVAPQSAELPVFREWQAKCAAMSSGNNDGKATERTMRCVRSRQDQLLFINLSVAPVTAFFHLAGNAKCSLATR